MSELLQSSYPVLWLPVVWVRRRQKSGIELKLDGRGLSEANLEWLWVQKAESVLQRFKMQPMDSSRKKKHSNIFFSTKYLAIVFCTLSNLTTLPSDEVGVSSLIYIWAKWDPERSGTCKAYRKQCRTGLETQVGIPWRTPTLTHHHLPDSRCPGRSCLPSSGWGLMSAPESKWQREVISPGPFSPLNLGRNPRAINTPPAWQRTLLKLTDDFAEKRKP